MQIAWTPPKNTGHWSTVEGYLVAYRPSEQVLDESDSWLPEGAAFEMEDLSVLSTLPAHRLSDGAATTMELRELDGSSEYAVAVLPRNRWGWGHHWSVAAYFSTAPDTLVPVAPMAPAVHPMDERCSEVQVPVPPAEFGRCRRPSLFEVQLRAGHDSDDASSSWRTVRRAIASPGGEVVSARVDNPSRPFQVRIIAMNAKGSSPPSEPTTVRPKEKVPGCVPDVDFDPDAPPSPPASSTRAKVVVDWQEPTARVRSAPYASMIPEAGTSGGPAAARVQGDTSSAPGGADQGGGAQLEGIAQLLLIGVACLAGGLGFVAAFRAFRRYLQPQRYAKVALAADEDADPPRPRRSRRGARLRQADDVDSWSNEEEEESAPVAVLTSGGPVAGMVAAPAPSARREEGRALGVMDAPESPTIRL